MVVSDFWEVHLEENSDNEKGVCVDRLHSVNNSVLVIGKRKYNISLLLMYRCALSHLHLYIVIFVSLRALW